jgi:hypothetical protein
VSAALYNAEGGGASLGLPDSPLAPVRAHVSVRDALEVFLVYALLLVAGCYSSPPDYEVEVTEECVVGESDGETLYCGEDIVFVCVLSDSSECWYDVDGARYYADGDCDDPRSWEDAAQEMGDSC